MAWGGVLILWVESKFNLYNGKGDFFLLSMCCRVILINMDLQ